jgi:hypothetical protein
VGLLVAVYFFAAFRSQAIGHDAYAYWAIDFANPYGRSFGNVDAPGAYRYSPAAALAMAPLSLLPWPVYLTLWTGVLIGCLVFVARRWALAVCIFLGIPMSLYLGNIDLLVAAAVVLGIRWPAFWAVAILTKPTSVIGLVWFLVRGEWRKALVALLATALIALPTVIVWPSAWGDWIAMLVDNASITTHDVVPSAIRYPIALLLTVLARRRPWVLGVAVAIAQPVFGLRSASVGVAALGIDRTARAMNSQARVED